VKIRLLALLLVLFTVNSVSAAKFNAYGLKFYTVETEHFIINYMDGTGHLVKKVASRFEELYSIYRNTYNIKLPNKTNVVILDSDESNGWALHYTNTITLWTHDFDFNMRGSHDWFEDVIAHEFAHIVSMSTAVKTPSVISDFRVGYFSHPNVKNRVEAIHSFPSEILPRWLSEGIAQYESTRNNGDAWDSHRDMIMRSLSLSENLLSWDHMQVFTGKGDDYEKTYNHGFSLVKYIAETYGYEKIPALLRASDKFTRLTFDRSIKEVLGISGKQLYQDWKKHLEKHYKEQVTNLGTQVYGKKINKYGYENYWPQFTPDGKGIFFLSNNKGDYGRKQMYLYSLSDTVKDDNKIKMVKPLGGFYDLNAATGKICYTSPKSHKSILPAERGGEPVRDLFIDTMPSDKKPKGLFHKKTEKQITIGKDIMNAVFSPDGKQFACAQRDIDKFRLVLTDTSGKILRTLYPADTTKNDLFFLYTINWASDGSKIAFSYFDYKNRKVAIFDTATKKCEVICDTDHDERDPRFSPDNKHLYFSSDRTGIFNIYRYEFASGKLEQVTNVTGGAFAPSISPDNKKLVYAGYAKEGYGIYYIDNIVPVKTADSSTLQASLAEKGYTPEEPCTLSISTPRKYSRLPRQLLLVPTFFAEQAVTQTNNVNKGRTVYKTGLIFNLIEPLTLSNLGNEIDGYILVEPKHLFSIKDFFIKPSRGFFNPDANYDIGLLGTTHALPFDISMDYNLRGIAGVDTFYNEGTDTIEELPYNVQMQKLNLQVSHYFFKSLNQHTSLDQGPGVHLLLGGNITDVNVYIDSTIDFKYTLDQGFRFGAMATTGVIAMNPRSTISPEGHVLKLQYTYNTSFALKEENSFNQNKERFDKYTYHEIRGHLKMGIPTPWYKKHDFHIDLSGVTVQNTTKDDVPLPSYFQPAGWLPGYSYFYKSQKHKAIKTNKDSIVSFDTLVLTGNNVIQGEFSYRFPLWKGLIDKKIGFLYLDQLYGAFNVSGGAAFDNPSDIRDLGRNDVLLSVGGEIRLETKTFNSFPMAIKLRYDRGLDKEAPVGGDRLTFTLGYDFDNWGTVLSPDYSRQKR
jgi:Tol biopolymer transport system component